MSIQFFQYIWTISTLCRVYHNSASGLGNSCGRFNIDDVIGCGISEEHLKIDSKFSKNGSLLPGQHVMLYFTKNGEMVCDNRTHKVTMLASPCDIIHKENCHNDFLHAVMHIFVIYVLQH